MQALEQQEREEVEWAEVLHVVHSGLVATRRLLWDESERKIIALLSSSSAFEGDHFLQVVHHCKDRAVVLLLMANHLTAHPAALACTKCNKTFQGFS